MSRVFYDLILERDGAQPFTKRALLSYIIEPFLISKDDPLFFSHINIWHAQEIVRALNQLKYVVDVIDYQDTQFIPHRSYDLFVGHGGINFENISEQLPGDTTKIYFSTGCYWKFHNQQELARFVALRKRRGIDLPLDRFIKQSEEGALRAADGIIGLGNRFTEKTYTDFSPVIMLNGASPWDDHYERCSKDYEKGRNHFLYFAGRGCVHKGLDLLLEAFRRLEKQHLWICSYIDNGFAEVYSDALFNHPNIHLIGWVQIRSRKLYDLMNTCNYAVLPSCSEGQAQAIVECMNQGLIPVVSRACGVDVGNYGVLLDPCNIDEIDKMIRRLSAYSTAQCRQMSQGARKTAITDFSESAFLLNITHAIQQIVNRKID